MSNCCSCIRGCTTDTYQPLSSQRFSGSKGKVYRDGREILKSPRNQRRKLSVRYDAVRPAGGASAGYTNHLANYYHFQEHPVYIPQTIKPIEKRNESTWMAKRIKQQLTLQSVHTTRRLEESKENATYEAKDTNQPTRSGGSSSSRVKLIVSLGSVAIKVRLELSMAHTCGCDFEQPKSLTLTVGTACDLRPPNTVTENRLRMRNFLSVGILAVSDKPALGDEVTKQFDFTEIPVLYTYLLMNSLP
ncbi:hypothetical protein WH47_07411 [Habropoda laboriosa]|uniref:Uncharacterized protein n=1 Tax=Habropoda laboriosa TaxID=597456 RepID=A0A0L7R645_9HYME|nr:hypothetical protein WH47_07411 [Habropoda laboriosa]